MRKRRFFTLIAMLSLASVAAAHTWLTQDTVDRMLSRMTSATEAIASSDSGPDSAALYELASASAGLATLINEEFAAHGAEQRDLLLAAIDGAEATGVNILWSQSHNRFFYDGDAYRRFIELAEPGEEDAEARYFLIETDFYLGDAGKQSELLARIDEKTEFLESYPDFRERARVMLFLGIDHRDLWRVCQEAGDDACSETHEKLAAERFRAVRDQNPDDEIGEVGERLLGRMEAEKLTAND